MKSLKPYNVYYFIMNKFHNYFRKRRGKLLKEIFPEIENYKILDIGGSENFWSSIGLNIKLKNITLLNIAFSDFEQNDDLKKVIYNGTTIPYKLSSFDLVICNSVIEHIKIKDRQKFADEVSRVSKRYFIQTPNYYFFIEPHFMLPFIHWLPKKYGWLLSFISPWKLLSRANNSTHHNYFWNTNLLTKKELKKIFKNTNLISEYFLFMKKSLCLVKKQ